MKFFSLPVLLFSVASLPAHSQDIDLDCETLTMQMIERLTADGLLVRDADSGQRARVIGLDLCDGAEDSAQQQHEEAKQEALDNWFLTKQPEKAGNKRLRNLKR